MSLRKVENSLDRRMWAGVGRAELAQQARREQKNKRSIGFSPRRERVARSLHAAFFTGKFTLYVAADEARFRERSNRIPSWAKDPMPVPKELLGHVFVKGRLPATFAIRPSRKLAGNDKLFALLNCGYLVVREGDFKRWLRSEHRRRRWPSQNLSEVQTRPVGRPNMVNPRLRNAILEIARDQVWMGDRQPITSLHRLLNDKGLDVPSVDTIARIVDELSALTGAPELHVALYSVKVTGRITYRKISRVFYTPKSLRFIVFRLPPNTGGSRRSSSTATSAQCNGSDARS